MVGHFDCSNSVSDDYVLIKAYPCSLEDGAKIRIIPNPEKKKSHFEEVGGHAVGMQQSLGGGLEECGV